MMRWLKLGLKETWKCLLLKSDSCIKVLMNNEKKIVNLLFMLIEKCGFIILPESLITVRATIYWALVNTSVLDQVPYKHSLRQGFGNTWLIDWDSDHVY